MDKKLKIAIIGSRGYPYVYSGYETLVKELSERLVKSGHQVRVYCHSSLFKKKPKVVKGIELIYIASIETKFLSQIVNSFFSFLHVCFSNVDVILVLNSANGPFGILTKIFRKKTCINVDGLEWLRPKWRGLGSYYFRISSKLATIFYDEIITDSNQMSIVYSKRFNKKSKTIAYGSTMVRTDSNKILEKFRLKKNDYYLIVGRLIPDNNSKLIVDGFLKSNSKKKLVIVGDVPYMDAYSSDIKKNKSDKIIFTGYINCNTNLSSLYINCYCYIHGHEFGGTNPTMINALDLNCNIVALKTKFNREMIGTKQVIFFEKKLSSVRKAIIKFENEQEVILDEKLNYILPDKFKWNYITNQYIELFYKLTSLQNT